MKISKTLCTYFVEREFSKDLSVIIISSVERVALGNGYSVTNLAFLLFSSTTFMLSSPSSCDFQKQRINKSLNYKIEFTKHIF